MSKPKKPTKPKGTKSPKKAAAVKQPKKVAFSKANLVKLIKDLSKRAHKDADLRDRLSRPADAKLEIAKYFKTLPADWKRYKFTFADVDKDESFHFRGGLAAPKDVQVVAAVWRSLIKPC